MRKIFLLLVTLSFSNSLLAVQLDGQLNISASFYGSSGAITGDLDLGNSTLQINPTTIWGIPATFLESELLTPGTYTRTHTLSTGGTITRTATIPSGKAGAYFVIVSNGNEYQLFNAWTVSFNGRDYQGINIDGNIFIGGSINGNRGKTTFSIPDPIPPTLDTTVNVDGGLVQECTQFGETIINASTTVIEIEGAVLDRVEWYLNSSFIGEGMAIQASLPLGTNALQAIAIATDGFTTGTDTVSVDVVDTTDPALQIQFLDGTGSQVTSASQGGYQVHFETSDICDPSPVSSGAAKPVMNVVEGDTIQINSGIDVQLPTTAVEVSGQTTDASGNTAFGQGVLLIQ